MALTDTFVRQVKHGGKPAGDKHTDGGGMYLLVKAGGKYWRMDYAYGGKRKTLALGVYPDVSLAQGRASADAARKLLADGIDPGAAKRQEKLDQGGRGGKHLRSGGAGLAGQDSGNRAAITQLKVRTWLEKDVFPYIGKMPISTIGPRDVLDKVVRKLEARGAHRHGAAAEADLRTWCSGTRLSVGWPNGT
jgi:hypothetical protein